MVNKVNKREQNQAQSGIWTFDLSTATDAKTIIILA